MEIFLDIPATIKSCLLTCHLLGLVLGLGAATMLDLIIVRFLITKQVKDEYWNVIVLMSKAVTAGLILLWVSGLGFLTHYGFFDADKLGNPKIWAKIIIVATLTLNGVFIHWVVLPLIRARVGRPLFDGLTSLQLSALLASGAISATSWWIPLILGAFPQLNFGVPASLILGTYSLILIAAIGFTQVILRYGLPQLETVTLTRAEYESLARKHEHARHERKPSFITSIWGKLSPPKPSDLEDRFAAIAIRPAMRDLSDRDIGIDPRMNCIPLAAERILAKRRFASNVQRRPFHYLVRSAEQPFDRQAVAPTSKLSMFLVRSRGLGAAAAMAFAAVFVGILFGNSALMTELRGSPPGQAKNMIAATKQADNPPMIALRRSQSWEDARPPSPQNEPAALNAPVHLASAATTPELHSESVGEQVQERKFTPITPGPRGTATKTRDVNQAQDAIAVQRRLSSLGYFSGPPAPVWGARSRAALKMFKQAHALPADDNWNETTEAVLFSSDAQPASFVGTWGIDATACESMPTLIFSGGAKAAETSCAFENKKFVAGSWNVVAACSNPQERWRANIRLTVSGTRLTWTSLRGERTYVRCDSPVNLAWR
jgi:hypothetical protein